MEEPDSKHGICDAMRCDVLEKRVGGTEKVRPKKGIIKKGFELCVLFLPASTQYGSVPRPRAFLPLSTTSPFSPQCDQSSPARFLCSWKLHCFKLFKTTIAHRTLLHVWVWPGVNKDTMAPTSFFLFSPFLLMLYLCPVFTKAHRGKEK